MVLIKNKKAFYVKTLSAPFKVNKIKKNLLKSTLKGVFLYVSFSQFFSI